MKTEIKTSIETQKKPVFAKAAKLKKVHLPLLLMLLPGVVLTFIFSYMPMFGAVIAFKNVNMRDGIWGSPWNGIDNFKFLFQTSDAWLITRNTIGYNLVFIIFGTAAAVMLAVILNLISNKRASKVYQTIFIMPHFLSFVIVGYLVFAFLSMENGFINKNILSLFGMSEINWYTEPKYWPWILIIVRFWKELGFSSVVYLAAIAGVDSELYEAARIDGANTCRLIWHITLPSIRMVVIIMTILNVGKILNSDFGLFYQVPMNSGALYNTTTVIGTYVYRMLASGQGALTLGLASAASFYQSIVGFVLVMVTNWIVNKIDSESAMF